MMTSNMLCVVEQRLRQSTLTTCTFQKKLVILVGDLAQLPAICAYTPKTPDIICRAGHITSAPCRAIAKQHTLQTSVRHLFDPVYLEFLNIIRHRPPTEIQIKHTQRVLH